MNMRKRFVDYVKNGGDEVFVSLPIGAGAGFDSKLAGKDWFTEATVEDTIHACEVVGGDVLLNQGLPGFEQYIPELVWKMEQRMEGNKRVTERWLETPHGTLHTISHEMARHGVVPTKYAMKYGDSLDMAEWYIDQMARTVPYVAEALGPNVEKINSKYALSIQWALQPFELFGLAMPPDLVMFAMTDPPRYRAICDRIRDVNLEIIKEVFKTGVDFVFLGGPGREMMSPELYETYMVPDSQILSKAVHDAGGLIYSHICSPIEPFLTMGYYGQMGIDLFETLSPPPVGNVESMAKARQCLPREMCTRGNIGLDKMVTGTTEDMQRLTLELIEQTRGYKHIIAASDYLFYDVPLENARAIVQTVEEYNRTHKAKA